MSIDKEKKSNRLLASRRYTHDSFTDSQESFTNVLDLQQRSEKLLEMVLMVDIVPILAQSVLFP